MNKIKRALMSAQSKLAISVAAAVASTMPTYCAGETGITALDNAKDFIINKLGVWGGGILVFIGLVMVGKAFFDQSSGQSQPGGFNKAIGVLVMGAIMLGGSVAVNIITGG